MPGTFTNDGTTIKGMEATGDISTLGTFVFKVTANDDLRLEGTYCLIMSATVQPNTGYALAITPSANLNLSNTGVWVADIVNGGTGYAVANVLTVQGGTGTAATLTVATVSGGVITSVTITTRGSYTANPTNPVSVSGGAGSNATFNLDLSTYHIFAWVRNNAWSASDVKRNGGLGFIMSSDGPPTTFSLVRAEIAAPGASYSVNNVLTLVGGTSTTAATCTVTSVSGGTVTGISITNAGVYTVEPAYPCATTVAPAGGSGCTINTLWCTSNSKFWLLDGSDTANVAGWTCYVMNVEGTPDFSYGTMLSTSLDRLGFRTRNTGTLTNKIPGLCLDMMRYGTGTTITAGTAGAPVTLSDISVYDINSARAWGALVQQDNIYYPNAKLRFGTSTQTAVTYFKDINSVLIWRNFPVSSLFYEILVRGTSGFSSTFQLGSYSSGLTSGGCSVKANSPACWALTASNAYGIILLYASNFSRIRRATLNASADIRSCTFTDCGNITGAGATIDSCTFQDIATASPISGTYGIEVTVATTITNCLFVNYAIAIFWNVNADTNTKLDDTTFVSGGTGYAIELGPNCPAEITFTNVFFDGYGSTGTANAAVYNNSGKEITINIVGGDSPTYNNGALASTIIDLSVTLTLTGVPIDTLVTIVEVADRDNVLFQDTADITEELNFTYGSAEVGLVVDIMFINPLYDPLLGTIYNYELGSGSLEIPISLVEDATYID